MSEKNTASRKPKMGTWGERLSLSQLIEKLQSNRSEFLELCRRITCDENAAVDLMGLVEHYLTEAETKDKERESSSDQVLTVIGAGLGNLIDSSRLRKIEVEVNLIQLLAEVHSFSLVQLRKQ